MCSCADVQKTPTSTPCKRDMDPRVFHWFSLECLYCRTQEKSLGNAKCHTAECVAAPHVGFRCGCCGKCFYHFGLLCNHLNQTGAHRRPAAPLYLTSSFSSSGPVHSFSMVQVCNPPSSQIHVPSDSTISYQLSSNISASSAAPVGVTVSPNIASFSRPPASSPAATVATSGSPSDDYLRSLVSFHSMSLAWLLAVVLNLPPSVLPARDHVDLCLRRLLLASPHWPASITDGETMDLRELLLLLQPHLVQHVTAVRRH